MPLATAPRRAAGVDLLGEVPGSGYREPPALARRADGQVVQLTPFLHLLLQQVDGERGPEELAAAVSAAAGRTVTADNVVALLDRLRALGLATGADGSEPEVERRTPLLGLRGKLTVADPALTRRLTTPFAVLFHPVVAVPVLALFAFVSGWVLLERGLASATYEAFASPGLLVVVLAVTVLSGGFHEFGHAAAARRGGATPGAMGAGFYLIWPAFWTDVTDSYRLGRGGRIRTDLGGLYFNALVVVATAAVWWLTRADAVLLVVATQLLQMLRQLLPFVRFDGYHVLADLTGVPDLFQRIGPTLASLVPGRSDPRAAALKPWARAVVTTWVLTVVPLLAAALVLLVLSLPRIVATAWAAAGAQWAEATTGAAAGDPVAAAGRALGALVVLLPVVALGYLLVRLGRQVAVLGWRRTAGRPARRALAVATALALLAGLAWAWWPDADRYRPVRPWEGGTLLDALPTAGDAGLAVGSRGAGTVLLPAGAGTPTEDAPALALVLVPRGAGGAVPGEEQVVPAGATSDADAGSGAAPQTWVFPFDEPLAPEEGDNQAVAVATEDGSVVYDVAFALVWADGEAPATQANESFAAASCRECAAVAVAFQVVLVVGEVDTVAPQNTAVSATYECTSCLTFSLAVQLFVTLADEPTEATRAEVARLWEEIAAFGAQVGRTPLDELQDRLTDYERQLLAVLAAQPGLLPDVDGPAPGEEASTGPADPSGSASPGGSGSPSGSASPEPGTTPSGTPSGTPAPGETSDVEPRGTASPSGSASSAPSASDRSSSSPSPSTTASSGASSPTASPSGSASP
ncbi:hypothetical protein [Nocardioides perillae]|uniref:Putative peptide zinc metalloprotease protein n=1 Tax=Nocardioides perillae TaxID=1119534 RepID=A0A7Y9RQT0_9ACTN|nr:hypothetical protein [Nocardioides perillae]NYG54595.1 putative peptide zinc metalloprotease protein [Nocardioides perillae]